MGVFFFWAGTVAFGIFISDLAQLGIRGALYLYAAKAKQKQVASILEELKKYQAMNPRDSGPNLDPSRLAGIEIPKDKLN